jgi:hypothetical protein
VTEIRLMPVKSRVRRGLIIKLFQNGGLFARFKKEHWPFGDTSKGETRIRYYIKLAEDFEAGKK